LTLGHSAGTYHEGTSAENLTDNLLSKKGILNDFDLVRSADQERQREQANMGALPFMALELLSEKGLDGMIPRRYRHEAEAFAWVLIYICVTTRECEGKIVSVAPNPFQCWLSKYWESCLSDKRALLATIGDSRLPIHGHTRPLLVRLYDFWYERRRPRRNSIIYRDRTAVAPEFTFGGIEESDESSDFRTFADLVAVFGKTLRANTQDYNHAVELIKKFKESGTASVQ
jgi:hypothetical protein